MLYGIMVVDDVNVLLVSRMLSGFGAGLTSTLASSITSEILPKSMSGVFCAMLYVWYSLMVVVPGLFGCFLTTNDPNQLDWLTDNWKLVLCLPAIITVIRLVLYLGVFRFEPVKFYLNKYDVNECRESIRHTLSKIYHADDVQYM